MSPLLTILGVLECLSSIACIFLYCFIIYILTKTSLFHSSFRTIYRIFSVSVIISMITFLYLSMRCFLQDLCFVDEPDNISNIAHAIQGISVYSYWLAFTAVSAERAFATVFVRSYERRFHSRASQLRLIIIFMLIDVIENISNYYFPNATLAFVCCFETTFCVTVLYVIRRVSARRNRIGADLSTRFQVKENVLLSTSMFPLMAMCFVWQIVLLPLVGIQLSAENEETRDLAIALLQFGSSLFLLSYALGFLRSAAMHKALRSVGLLKEVKVTQRSETEQYAQWMETQRAAWRID